VNRVKHFRRTHWMGDLPIARPLPIEGSTQMRTYIYASSWIRTLNPRVRAVQGNAP